MFAIGYYTQTDENGHLYWVKGDFADAWIEEGIGFYIDGFAQMIPKDLMPDYLH